MSAAVQELLEKARTEIMKARGHVPDDEKKKEEDAKTILNQSVMFADNVLKRLIALTIGKDVHDVFENLLDTRGSVLMSVINQETKEEKKYTLTLDIVDSDYMLELGELNDHPEVKQRLTFLLNTVKILYCPLKDYMKKWITSDKKYPLYTKNGALEYSDFKTESIYDSKKYDDSNNELNIDESGSTFNYVLQIGLNTTLFLDKDTKKRIGIILKEVDDFPNTEDST